MRKIKLVDLTVVLYLLVTIYLITFKSTAEVIKPTKKHYQKEPTEEELCTFESQVEFLTDKNK